MKKQALSLKAIAFPVFTALVWLALGLFWRLPVDLTFIGPAGSPLQMAAGLAIKLLPALLVAYIAVNGRLYLSFLRSVLGSRTLLLNLAKNDFKKKFASSYLGSIWGFIMPLIQIVTFWFVFQVGFKSGNVGDCPYILWLIAGIVPWFFIADSIQNGASVFLEYSFLVKKIVFRIELLPFVKVISAFFVHLFFLGVVFAAFLLQGYPLSVYAVQILYYIVCLFCLLFTLALLFSTLTVFVRDIGQVVMVLVQIGFWFTPIGWVFAGTISGSWQILFKLNPFFYIVEGYRQALVYRIWFWENPYLTVYFWLFVFLGMLVSIRLFNRLKPHFADLL